MNINDLSGNDTTGGQSLLAKWRMKRTVRKQEKAKNYLKETGASPIDNIINFIKTSWLMILIVIAVVVFLWRLIFKRKSGGIFRRKRNSGRSFYLRMKRAKARKAGK
jgi:hypothetical protein